MPNRITLCRECYKRHLSLQILLKPGIDAVARAVASSFLPPGAKLDVEVEVVRTADFTEYHAECDNCKAELPRLGYDLCAELLIFYDDIEPIDQSFKDHGAKPLRVLRLFGWYIGSDRVSENGDYLQFWDIRLGALD